MTGRTRYGELLHDAARHIAAAGVELERQRFTDPGTAQKAIDAHRDLLHALHRHGAQLAGPARLGNRSANRVDHRAAAGVHLVEELATLGRRTAREPATPGPPVASQWTAAAGAVRTASDVLATHRVHDGVSRSPAAAVLDDPAGAPPPLRPGTRHSRH